MREETIYACVQLICWTLFAINALWLLGIALIFWRFSQSLF